MTRTAPCVPFVYATNRKDHRGSTIRLGARLAQARLLSQRKLFRGQSTLVAFLLAGPDHREHGAQTLVLHDRTRSHQRLLVEQGIWQQVGPAQRIST